MKENIMTKSSKFLKNTKISIILLSWKRESNIDLIINSYENIPIVDEIIIWNNNHEVNLNSNIKTKIINSSEDMGMRTRFAAGLFARNDCLIFHDDDTLLPQETIIGLYLEWEKNPDIMHGLWGCIPKEDGTYSLYVDPPAKVDMIVGRCMVLKNQYCREFFTIEHKYPAPNDHSAPKGCEDILMSYMIMNKSGKKNQCHSYEHIDLPYENAICRRPNHYNQRTQFMQICENWLDENSLKKR